MRMLETGILEPGDPFELIGGELVAMAAKGLRHEGIKNELMLYWSDRRPKHIKFAIEAPLRLGPFDEPEPDITLFPATLGVNDVRGDSVLLVVEVADTSWPKDSGLKAAIYARFGVRDYWIVNTVDGTTRVHRRPTGEGYAEIRDQPFSDPLVPEFVPELAVRLADLVATDDR
jgi:Uma2 family endonuclease